MEQRKIPRILLVVIRCHVPRSNYFKPAFHQNLVDFLGAEQFRERIPFLNSLLNRSVLFVLFIVLVSEAPLVICENGTWFHDAENFLEDDPPIRRVAGCFDRDDTVKRVLRKIERLHVVSLLESNRIREILLSTQLSASLHLILVQSDTKQIPACKPAYITRRAADAAAEIQNSGSRG